MAQFANGDLARILLAVLGTPEKVKSYMEFSALKGRTGEEMLRFAHLREFDEIVIPAAKPDVQAEFKNNSLLPYEYRCGFHPDARPFSVQRLRPLTQRTDLNEFLVVHYVEPVKGRDACNGLFMEVIVCPQCFFASTEQKHFITKNPERGEDFKSDFNPSQKTLNYIFDKRAERLAVGKGVMDLFSPVKTHKTALTAFELAVMSMKAIHDSSPARYNRYPTLIAMMYLQSAQLCRESGDKAREETCLRAAFDMLKNAEELGRENPRVFYKNILRVVKLALHFGDIQTASRFASDLVQMKIQSIQLLRNRQISEPEYRIIAGFAERAVDQLHDYKEMTEYKI
ncbi:MAG: DUF2225 domain-containing protein [Planctomycetes bacterium]|nr:DUF2225 domain-containing protein [Planctomycetota bacterium]